MHTISVGDITHFPSKQTDAFQRDHLTYNLSKRHHTFSFKANRCFPERPSNRYQNKRVHVFHAADSSLPMPKIVIKTKQKNTGLLIALF